MVILRPIQRVLPHVEIRRVHDWDRPEEEVCEVILDSVTVVSSPVRPVARPSP
ncbi:MAG: hypothetical protein PHH46_05950 [Firmicutes bacterium]|nr:hypothetical protein [Bacillota bacterium]